MRYLIVASMLILGSLSTGAFADEAPAANTVDNAPQCTQVEVDGKTTTACFNLSDEQVQGLGVQTIEQDSEAYFGRHHCEVRCVVFDHFGRCRQWHRVCW